MRTKIFAYKGFVGIMSGVKADGLLNDPLAKGQLGFVVDAECIDIQPEALDLLKKVKRSGDDIGDVDVGDGKSGVWVSWLGGPLKCFKPDDITGSNSYDASLLKPNDKVETPQDFKDYIEGVK